MTAQKKTKPNPGVKESDVSVVEAETQDEIEQIMSEIEDLQQEINDVPQKTSATGTPPSLKVVSNEDNADEEADDILREFRANGGAEPSIEDTLGGLQDEEGAGEPSMLASITETKEVPMAPEIVHSDETSNEVSEGTLTMTLTGNMTLKLKYDFEGQEVVVGFSNNALKVQMSDGTEFKIPVKGKAYKKAA